MKHFVKNLLGICSCAVSIVAASGAYASPSSSQEGTWYAGGSGDVTWLRHSNTGGGANLDVGYHFTPDVRIEGEVGYHNAPGSSGYTDTYYFTYMGNVYYDFNKLAFSPGSSWQITPYIGGGAGMASVRFGNSNFASTFHHHENDFAYQGMAGLTFVADSMPNTDWVAGYRYVGADARNIEANNIELGVRFRF